MVQGRVKRCYSQDMGPKRRENTLQPEIIAKWIPRTLFYENNSQTIFPCNSLNHKGIRDYSWFARVARTIRANSATKNPLPPTLFFLFGCGFFAYSWQLPTYSGAFLLTVDNFSFFTHSWSLFTCSFRLLYLQLELFCLQWESASNKRLKLDCKQRSLTGKSMFIQCGCWEESISPYTSAKLQPNTG